MPTEADFDGDIIARKVSTTEAIIVCSPDYIVAHGAPATPEELIGHEVLRPWISGRLSLYAALPSRKFMPERTRVFLDVLAEHIRKHQNSAVRACQNC